MDNSSNNIYGNLDNVDQEINIMAKNTIHDNVVLKEIVYENEEDKTENIQLKFQKTQGGETSVFTQRIFPLNRPSEPWADDEWWAKEIATWNSIMKHIATKHGINDADYKIAVTGATSFQDFYNRYNSIIGPKLSGQLMYLKIYSRKNYGALPKFPPFLQTMASGECALSFTDYEKKEIAKTTVKATDSDFTEVGDDFDDLDI